MSDQPRPPAVTTACVFVGVSALLLLANLSAALGNWGTIEMQDGLRPTLQTLNDRGVDVTMGELLGTLRWAGFVGVALLIAALVFAIFTVRGDRASRVGTTVLAVLIGLFVVPLGILGVLQAVFLFAAAFTLWSADARRWFAAQASQGSEAARGGEDDGPPRDPLGPVDPDAGVPSADPYEGTPHGPAAQETVAQETVAQERGPEPAVGTPKRPTPVLAAGIVTVTGSALVGLMSGIFVLVYSLARDEYVRLVQDGPMSGFFRPGELEDGLQAGFWISLVMLPLAAAGVAAGISLLARLPIGRRATLVLAWITVAAGIVAIPLGLLGTAAAIVVIVLLNRAESRAWTGSPPGV